MPLQMGPRLTCFLLICTALSRKWVTGECSQGQDTPIAPSVEIKTSSPGDLMPIGYSVTLTCVGRKSERYTGIYQYTLIRRIVWWRGNQFLKQCGGGRHGGEEMLSCEVDIVNGTSTDTGEYECSVWIFHGRCFFLVRNLTWLVPYVPGFIMHPKSLVVGWNANLTLECVAKGFPEPSIEWRRNNSTLTNVTVVGIRSRSLLILSSVTAAKDDGNYSCVASNDVGVAVSNAGAIHIKKIRVGFSRHPTNQTAAPGDTVKFDCSVSGYLPNQITWLKDGKRTESGLWNISVTSGTSSLNLVNVDGSDQGAYTCQVDYTEGVLTSKTGYLFVRNPQISASSRPRVPPDPPQSLSSNIIIWSVVGATCAVVTATLTALFARVTIIKRKKKTFAMEVQYTPVE